MPNTLAYSTKNYVAVIVVMTYAWKNPLAYQIKCFMPLNIKLDIRLDCKQLLTAKTYQNTEFKSMEP